MRETKIETVQGYMGTYHSILQPRDTQLLNFLHSDPPGPFWLTPTQAEACHHDVMIETKNTDRTVIIDNGPGTKQRSEHKRKKQKRVCQNMYKNTIETKEELKEKTKVHWVVRRVCCSCMGARLH